MCASRGRRAGARGALAAAALTSVSALSPAQTPSPGLASTDSVADSAARSAGTNSATTVVPGLRYRAGRLHRMLLGADYRDLWTTPITVGVLDLRTFAGGLRPTERGGGLQTNSLRFDAPHGREYVFRSLDKDNARAMPPELRETFVRWIVQDQVSAFHPAGALIVARLLDATGIRHARPALVVLPDGPLLGEFRAAFAGQLGTFEERPKRGFAGAPDAAGAVEVVSSDRLFAMMRKSHATRVDSHAFLAARLFDVFVGDRDRHRDQWRWARFGPDESTPWEPVPRDRDMAFVKSDGVLLRGTRLWYPDLVTFRHTYPSMFGLTWSAREIDRRLLAGLERAVWDSVARALQAQLADSVIDAAVAVMPQPMVAVNGAELRRTLIHRRDRLRGAAAEFYALLAREVDLYGTDEPDLAEVTRLDDGSVDVSLSARTVGDTAASSPYARRRFSPGETKEVRLYLEGGDDRAVVRGGGTRQRGTRGVVVRVIGGDGADELVDSASADGGATRFYDSSPTGRMIRGSATAVDRRMYVPPPTKRPRDPPRDWGQDWRPAPWVSSGPDVGLFLGAGGTLTRYAFRSHPYASRTTLQAGYAFGARTGRAQLASEIRRSNSRSYATVRARASGIEVLRFHGLGNETPSDQPGRFYRVHQQQYLLEPTYTVPLARNLALSFGAAGQYAVTDVERGTFIDQARPYGSDAFAQAGARLGLALDTRDRPFAPTRGVDAAAGGTLYPGVWDVATAFQEAHGTAAAYWRVAEPLEPTVALRVGGKRVWGTFPFHESAFLGGASTLRGWGEQRFAGRASVYGNAELRLYLTKFFFIVPGDFGVFGLADAGRVYASGERSDAWHAGAGGGVWIAPLTRANTVSLAVARGNERTGVYLRSGFMF